MLLLHMYTCSHFHSHTHVRVLTFNSQHSIVSQLLAANVINPSKIEVELGHVSGLDGVCVCVFL